MHHIRWRIWIPVFKSLGRLSCETEIYGVFFISTTGSGNITIIVLGTCLTLALVKCWVLLGIIKRVPARYPKRAVVTSWHAKKYWQVESSHLPYKIQTRALYSVKKICFARKKCRVDEFYQGLQRASVILSVNLNMENVGNKWLKLFICYNRPFLLLNNFGSKNFYYHFFYTWHQTFLYPTTS